MESINLVMNVILISVGTLFTIFGYLIYFRKKYNLINNFKINKSINKYSDDYALRMGFIELWSGIFCICLGILSLIIGQRTVSIVLLITCMISVISALVINDRKSQSK